LDGFSTSKKLAALFHRIARQTDGGLFSPNPRIRDQFFASIPNSRSILCFNSQVEGSGSRLRSVRPSALQIAEVLMQKLLDIFSKTFVREGVVHVVDTLECSLAELLKDQPMLTPAD
jgi:hypothetical protein